MGSREEWSYFLKQRREELALGERKDKRPPCLLSVRLLSLSLLAFSCASAAFADDWGYEGTKPPVEEQSAAGMLKSIKGPVTKPTNATAKKTPAKAGTAKAASGAKTSPKNQALEDDSEALTTTTAAPSTTAAPASAMPSTRNGGGFARSVAPHSSGSRSTTSHTSESSTSNTGMPAEPDSGNLGVVRTTEYVKKPKAPATVAKGPMTGGTPSLPNTKDTFSKLDNPLENFTDKNQQAVRCWLQLFQVVSRERMDYADQKKLEAYMLQKARQGAKQTEELRSILKFWPQLMTDIRNKQELELEYSDLFRALLRVHERYATEKTNVEGSEFESDSDLITRLLGLQRTAVSGNPSFSEDAVNAYADMAIFIYEQQHAGRTIDANDNRALFAKVVVEKFNQAPTDNDKRAMSSFDLAWAKFKIIWRNADEEKRKVLLEKLVKTGAGSSLSVAKDPLLDQVLSNWPWKTSL